MRLTQLRQRLRDHGALPCHEHRVLRLWSQALSQDSGRRKPQDFLPLGVRAELAARLSAASVLPSRLARRLAHDEFEVASPLLGSGPLSQDDLISVATSGVFVSPMPRKNANSAAATITAAAITARGTYCKAGIKNNKDSSTKPMEKITAQPERAPAYNIKAERENDVLVGKLPDKAEASLDRPCPNNSVLSSQRRPSRWHSMRALEAVSRKLTKAITIAGSHNWLSTSQPGH